MKIYKYIIGLFFILSLNSCEDFLEEDPSAAGGVLPEDVFSAYDKAQAAMVGAYDALGHYYFDGLSSVICADIIGGDMMLNSTGNYNWFVPTYQMNVLPTYNDAYNPWTTGYNVINNANNLIYYADGVPDATDEEVDFLIGQGYALRAYTYLRLVQMYAPAYARDAQGMGLILRTEPTDSESPDLQRSTLQETYDLILSDLDKAEKLLDYGTYKGILDKRSIHALKARAYLLTENWEEASKYAEAAIMGTLGENEEGDEGEVSNKMGLEDNENNYFAGFTIPNAETMFYLDYTTDDNNVYLTVPSFYFPSFGYSSVRANDKFVDMFDDGDFRKNVFVYNAVVGEDGYIYDGRNYNGPVDTYIDEDNYVIFKFGHLSQVGDAKAIKIRSSEMYLIWAEAEAELGNDTKAQSVITEVIQRSNPFAKKPTVTGEELVQVILDERRKELYGEGFRWFDIKRRQQFYKREGDHWVKFDFGPEDHDYYRLTYPIPQYEIDANLLLTEAEQNIGY